MSAGVDATEMDDRERDAAEALLFRLADDEYVLAERYTEWQLFAPTLESDLALANVAQDEFGHARLWYDLLQSEFGWTEPDLLYERDPADFRHCTLVELPFEEGDWADPVLRGYLYDVAEVLRLEALADSSYRRIADPVEKILSEERYHREHAQNWLERLCEGEESRDRVQSAVDRLFPYALTIWEPTARDDAIEEFGLRTDSLSEMREQWLDTVVPFLESLGLTVPEPERPDARGRDGEHTDAWFDLFAEYTHTWDELDRTDVRRLREEDDDDE